MKHVELHIEHEPMGMKAAHASFKYNLIFKKTDGSTVTRDGKGTVTDTTRNRITLDALIESLDRLREPVELVIYSSNEYIVNMLNRGMYLDWEKNGYRNKKGKLVADYEKWQQLTGKLKGHSVKAIKK